MNGAVIRPGLPAERFGRAVLGGLERFADRTAIGRLLFEVLMFGLKQAWACVFGGALLAMIFLTHVLWPRDAFIARYDALVAGALLLQAAMLLLRLEDLQEAAAILVFHVVGTVMELFKTSTGSWLYPEPSLLRIAGVPLFSGFMYASVGSYIARVWRIQDMSFEAYPPIWMTLVLALAIYANFFADHYGFDVRWILFGAAALIYRRTVVLFRPNRIVRRMPLLLGFGLVALFIWFAENLATFSHAWLYAAQRTRWRLVAPEKLGSWLLLAIISFVLVSLVRGVRSGAPSPPASQPRGRM
jgi:uncharacterized membrane protein YoaT (DUF817 family)